MVQKIEDYDSEYSLEGGSTERQFILSVLQEVSRQLDIAPSDDLDEMRAILDEHIQQHPELAKQIDEMI